MHLGVPFRRSFASSRVVVTGSLGLDRRHAQHAPATARAASKSARVSKPSICCGHAVEHILRDAQVLDGGPAHERLSQLPEALAILGRANNLAQLQIHVLVH